MAIEIYSSAGTLLQTIPRVLTASITDKLDGTLTFDFTGLTKNAQPILPGMAATSMLTPFWAPITSA